MGRRQAKDIVEFGDFQTPYDLAYKATRIIGGLGVVPRTILEPTCGKGAFLFAALDIFPYAKKIIGIDINRSHIASIKQKIAAENPKLPVTISCANFFTLNWPKILEKLPEPILILGNPPWVTNAELSILKSSNLPKKSNFLKRKGLDAVTGKSNFDISEWMLLHYIEWLQKRRGVIAVLCKTSVARKVLAHAWKNNYRMSNARIYKIDASKHFQAFVEAAFFVVEFGAGHSSLDCHVYDNLDSLIPAQTIEFHDGLILSDIAAYQKWSNLRGKDYTYTWRSGVKHDCSKVLEIERNGKSYRNGFDNKFELERAYIYPMLKSSDIANGNISKCRKYLLLTQKHIGEDTSQIREFAPKTWRYIESYENEFLKRRSSIYKKRPRFSIFGVGDYTFAPWKVAISGFYKKLEFKCIGPIGNRPAILDDTIYFLPCLSNGEAQFLTEMLNSVVARQFLSSMIFWDNKRPVTIELLKQLDLHALSIELGREKEYLFYSGGKTSRLAVKHPDQLSLNFRHQGY